MTTTLCARRSWIPPPIVAVALLAGCGARTPLVCDRFLPIVREPVTVYFVLDHSASMAEAGKWMQVRDAVAAVAAQITPAARVAAAIFPAPGSDGCDPGAVVLPPTADDASAALMRATDSVPSGGTPLAATLDALALPQIAEWDVTRVVAVVVTDGGPNCNPSLSCRVERCTRNIDGLPDCAKDGPSCCEPSAGAPDAASGCLDDQRTVQRIAALQRRGIRTFIVGIPGSDVYADALDALAEAGGTARAGAPRYYRATDADPRALVDALQAVIVELARPQCDVRLEVIVPSDVIVMLDGASLANDERAGWTADGVRITLHGGACEQRRGGAELRVRYIDECAR